MLALWHRFGLQRVLGGVCALAWRGRVWEGGGIWKRVVAGLLGVLRWSQVRPTACAVHKCRERRLRREVGDEMQCDWRDVVGWTGSNLCRLCVGA